MATLKRLESEGMRRTFTISLTVLILLLTIELSFTKSLALNLWVLGASFMYLLWQRRFGGCLALVLLPLLPALGTFWSVALHGSGNQDGFILASRTYAFAAMGLVFALGVDLEELLLALEQRGLPANFVYGLLVVIHALPQISQEIKDTKEAALYKGGRLTSFSPMLYFKTLVVAFDWQKKYTQAMYAHGYDENGQRSHYYHFRESKLALGLMILFMLSCNLWLFI